MAKSRYWQAVRGICILAVIMIHCPVGAEWTRSNSMVGVKGVNQFSCCNIYFYGRIFYKAGKSKC